MNYNKLCSTTKQTRQNNINNNKFKLIAYVTN